MIITKMAEVDILLPRNFRMIQESLKRIGIKCPSVYVDGEMKNVLMPVCHILHKRGRYYIAHYKELQKLDGSHENVHPEDISKRELVIEYLEEWNLCKRISDPEDRNSQETLTVIKHSEKDDWLIITRYQMGIKK